MGIINSTKKINNNDNKQRNTTKSVIAIAALSKTPHGKAYTLMVWNFCM